MKITASETSCSCTSPNLNIIDSRHFKFNIEIHTAGFGIGRFVKHMTIHYQKDGSQKEEKIPFNFEGTIIQKS